MNLEFILQDNSRENANLDCAEIQITSIQWKISNQPETRPVLLYDLKKNPKKTKKQRQGGSTSSNSFSGSTYLHDEANLVIKVKMDITIFIKVFFWHCSEFDSTVLMLGFCHERLDVLYSVYSRPHTIFLETKITPLCSAEYLGIAWDTEQRKMREIKEDLEISET